MKRARYPRRTALTYRENFLGSGVSAVAVAPRREKSIFRAVRNARPKVTRYAKYAETKVSDSRKRRTSLAQPMGGRPWVETKRFRRFTSRVWPWVVETERPAAARVCEITTRPAGVGGWDRIRRRSLEARTAAVWPGPNKRKKNMKEPGRGWKIHG